MNFEELKEQFELNDQQIAYFHEVLEALEFSHEDIHMIIDLAQKELSMNTLLSILGSFGMYESADEIDEDYFDLIVSSIHVIVESIKEMKSYIDHQNMIN